MHFHHFSSPSLTFCSDCHKAGNETVRSENGGNEPNKGTTANKPCLKFQDGFRRNCTPRKLYSLLVIHHAVSLSAMGRAWLVAAGTMSALDLPDIEDGRVD